MAVTWRQGLLAGIGITVLAALVWQADRLATRQFQSEGASRAETALRLTVNALAENLARYEAVPQLLAEFDAIRLLASRPDDPVQRAAIDTILRARNATLQSSDIYIMDMSGETIAASNFDRPDSFVGQNFTYRPYFSDAITGHPTRFYALGTTSGVRGYYFSAPVRDLGGRIAGVIAVKIGVDALEASWRGGEFRIFVTDPEGIVFMSEEPDWLYGGIYELTTTRRERTAASRRYSDAALHQLPYAEWQEPGATIASMTESGVRRDYISVVQEMPQVGWTVHVLLDRAPLLTQARMAVATLLLLLAVAGALAAVFAQRRARVAERMALQSQARTELEHRVAERTADLARVNSRLETEIAERRATEAKLRRTQANLIQAGKLAALGQMSAALSHEINQPLAAARNYADSAAILIDRGDTVRARENVQAILSLVDRMAAIGRHLRNAARKPNEKLGPVRLAPLLAETRVIVAQRLAAVGAVLEIDLPADFPALRAGATRLQQVLINIIANAADAVEGAEERRIDLSARVEGGRGVIRIRDRGPGVPPSIAERIFDPFYTTKGVGAGLGLGLSITYNIVKDFGGEIRLADAAPGAEFAIYLPLADAAEAAA